MAVPALVREIEARVEQAPVRNVPALRSLRREYSKHLRSLPAEDVVRVADSLIARGRVHRFVGDELIANHPHAPSLLDRTLLERLGAPMASWDQVDSFALYLSGPAWRERRIGDRAIAEWARSENRWWRRAALVSTVPLNVKAQGGRGEARRTLRVCRLLMDDRDPMIAKALSWALRALAVPDPEAVRRFVAENESALPALVRREVRNKLATGRKNRRATR
jgi:hypothetical protein